MTTIVLENLLFFGRRPPGELHVSSLETSEAPESFPVNAGMEPSEGDVPYEPATSYHHHRPHADETTHHHRPHEREYSSRPHKHAPSHIGATPPSRPVDATPPHRKRKTEEFLSRDDYRLTDSPHHHRPFEKEKEPFLTPEDYRLTDRQHHRPHEDEGKRHGIGDRYKVAMRIAEDQLGKEGVAPEHRRAAAAALVGNASAESELDPTTIHDHGTGYGIYGARNERRTAMLDWLASHGYEKDSLVGQTRHMVINAKQRGGEAWDALTGATKENVFDVGRTVTEKFEAPRRINDRRAQVRAAYEARGEAAPAFESGATPRTGGGGATPGRIGALVPASGKAEQIAGVDQRLMSALAAGASHLPPGYRVEPFSGYSPTHGAAGSRHRLGQAVDVTIYDPSGKAIPNRGADTTGMYRKLAQHTYGEMLKTYPDLAPRFAHGAQFETSRGSRTQDLMHYDIGGPRRSAGPQFSPTIQELGPIPERSAEVP